MIFLSMCVYTPIHEWVSDCESKFNYKNLSTKNATWKYIFNKIVALKLDKKCEFLSFRRKINNFNNILIAIFYLLIRWVFILTAHIFISSMLINAHIDESVCVWVCLRKQSANNCVLAGFFNNFAKQYNCVVFWQSNNNLKISVLIYEDVIKHVCALYCA